MLMLFVSIESVVVVVEGVLLCYLLRYWWLVKLDF